jgi:DNA primase
MEVVNKFIFSELERIRIVEAAKTSLWKPHGKKALDYLLTVRGFTEEMIKKFELGYCPLDVNHEVRGRIIIPFYDTYKKLIVISTRHLDMKHKKRFLHEPFKKSFYVYGLYNAKNEIIKKNKVIIVEGEFDAISLHSNNLAMTVAICGSSLSLFQVAILSKYCSEFYLLFDGDKAGRSATKRAIDMYKEYGLSRYISFFPVYLPDKTDPEEFVQKYGRKELINKMISAKEDYF